MGQPQYKAYNELNVFNPIHLLTVTRKSLRKANSVIREEKNADNHLNPSIDTVVYLKIINNMFLYRRRNKLTTEAMELLIYCYLVFLRHSEGVTSQRVCRDYNKDSDSELQSARNKLNTLERKGYLLKIGKTFGGAFLYIPSVKAIDDLKNIFK